MMSQHGPADIAKRLNSTVSGPISSCYIPKPAQTSPKPIYSQSLKVLTFLLCYSQEPLL